ncbi:hypothetical protein [Streptomyces sp. AS58]|uniref:hypothetical protein n=1 Tax=Streptomyces sp. AS58 TaxID=1519489 RepID=UPI000B0BBFC1|nr:hypothetical protein [Streptomyces sp. AS58]
MSDRDPPGATPTAPWTVGNLAAATLLGITVHEQTVNPDAADNSPLSQPDTAAAA